MAKVSRDQWVDAAVVALGNDGAEAVRVESLAKMLGVSKGSFYWHFKDRGALLEAVIAAWEEGGTHAIIREVQRAGGSEVEQLWTLMRFAFGGSTSNEAFEVEIRAFAMRSEVAEVAVARVDRLRLKFVVGLLVAAGIPTREAKWRADLFYRMLVGEYFMHRSGTKRLSRASLKHMHAFMVGPPGD